MYVSAERIGQRIGQKIWYSLVIAGTRANSRPQEQSSKEVKLSFAKVRQATCAVRHQSGMPL